MERPWPKRCTPMPSSCIASTSRPATWAASTARFARDWDAAEARICLAFPDVYDIGMSHLGFKILYKILNDDPRTLAERAYAPWVDMEKELRARRLPLVSLETAPPLKDFDVVGFSLQFELTYSNVLTMLDLGGIPLRAADRGEADPLVIAGGPTATHPEPLAMFLDAVCIGDGEERTTEVSLLWTSLKKQGVPRRERLVAIARLRGVYVPSLYALAVDPDIRHRGRRSRARAPASRCRCVAPSSTTSTTFPFPDDGPVGGPEAIFDRMSIENRARLHRGLPLLSGRHDLPARARARSATDRRRHHRHAREEERVRRGEPHLPLSPPATRASRRSSRR